MLHFMTDEFRYEFMYMKNIMNSEMKSGVPRLQMPVSDLLGIFSKPGSAALTDIEGHYRLPLLSYPA